MDGTMRVLEKRFSMYLILVVLENPGISKSDAVKKDNLNYKTKYTRMEELIETGIFEVKNSNERNNYKYLFLTEKGREIAEHLKAVHDLLDPIDCPNDDY